MITLALYGVLGVVLNVIGVNIVNRPAAFLAVIVVVVLIGASSKYSW